MKPGAGQGSPLRVAPGVCRGSVPGPMMGDHSFGSCCPEDVAVRCRPPSGELTHAPADPRALYRAIRRSLLHRLGRPPGSPKVGSRMVWWRGRRGGGGGGESLEPFLGKCRRSRQASAWTRMSSWTRLLTCPSLSRSRSFVDKGLCHPCRVAEADPHDVDRPVDHADSAVAVH